MQIFSKLFQFFWWLTTQGVTIGGYVFTLRGAIIFALLFIVGVAFLKWLFID